jgi:hypothetical protein
MRTFRKLLALFVALLIVAAVWLWWNRPQKVDMTAYVPADSLVYIEANSLPEIASGIVETDAWKSLAPPAGIKGVVGQIGWLGRLSAWTGIGSADSVVLSRAQVAIAVLGLDAADAGETLKIKPRTAVVVETHTGESRTREAVEKRVGDFARRAYGQPQVERKKVDELEFVTWRAPLGERRIVATVTGSVAILGNDEAAVRACLAVRRGERPSLAGNVQLEDMRSRVQGNDAIAFGYVSPVGAARLLEFVAMGYAGQIAQEPREQSLAASLLPQLASKILGGAGWSARFANGVVEDRYFISLHNDLAARLRTPLTPSGNATANAAQLLPAETYSLSRYNYQNPDQAWSGLKSAISSQVDMVGAMFVLELLDAALKPYGIDDPKTFLRAIGSEIVTARLQEGAGTVTIVEVKDEKTLRDFVSKRLGPKPRTERISDAEMLVSADPERSSAASFIAGRLLMGSEENVRQCLEAISRGQLLSATDAFQRATRLTVEAVSDNAITYTKADAPARSFIIAIASQREARSQPVNNTDLERALQQLPYTVSETRLVEGGFEKRTRSAFGQFGTIAEEFAPNKPGS